MILLPLLGSLFVVAPLPQDGASAVPTDAELAAQGWEQVDGVACQIGDEIFTLSTLEAEVTGRTPPPPQAQAIQRMMIRSLIVQAGEDLGAGTALVERGVRHDQRVLRREQGARAYSELFTGLGVDPRNAETVVAREQHRQVWVRIQRGLLGPGGEPRPIRDPYVRPGILRSLYKLTGDELQRALGEPDEVRFQGLLVAAEPLGSLEAAKDLADELVERARDGEDFSGLVDVYSAGGREGQGLSAWYDPATLSNPPEREFGLGAAVGDISEPIPLLDPAGEAAAYRILRLHERREGRPAPPFVHREAQDWLRRSFEDAWMGAVENREIGTLLAHAHIWVHPALEAPPLPTADGL